MKRIALTAAAIALLPSPVFAAAEEGKGILADTNLWVLIAFLIVVGIFVMAGIPAKAAEFFRTRADGVRTSLDNARSVREDAQRLLADYQKRQREAESEAEAIIDQAKADAKSVAAEMRTKLDEQIARRKKAAEERIARAEAQAVAAMRGQTADLAIAAASHIVADRVDDKAQSALLDRSISDLRGLLN